MFGQVNSNEKDTDGQNTTAISTSLNINNSGFISSRKQKLLMMKMKAKQKKEEESKNSNSLDSIKIQTNPEKVNELNPTTNEVKDVIPQEAIKLKDSLGSKPSFNNETKIAPNGAEVIVIDDDSPVEIGNLVTLANNPTNKDDLAIINSNVHVVQNNEGSQVNYAAPYINNSTIDDIPKTNHISNAPINSTKITPFYNIKFYQPNLNLAAPPIMVGQNQLPRRGRKSKPTNPALINPPYMSAPNYTSLHQRNQRMNYFININPEHFNAQNIMDVNQTNQGSNSPFNFNPVSIPLQNNAASNQMGPSSNNPIYINPPPPLAQNNLAPNQMTLGSNIIVNSNYVPILSQNNRVPIQANYLPKVNPRIRPKSSYSSSLSLDPSSIELDDLDKNVISESKDLYLAPYFNNEEIETTDQFIGIDHFPELLEVSSFLRTFISVLVPDWPPSFCEPDFICLILHVPKTHFAPVYLFLVTQLIQILKDLNKSKNKIEPCKLYEIKDQYIKECKIKRLGSTFNNGISNWTPKEKLRVLKNIIDSITETTKFGIFYDDIYNSLPAVFEPIYDIHNKVQDFVQIQNKNNATRAKHISVLNNFRIQYNNVPTPGLHNSIIAIENEIDSLNSQINSTNDKIKALNQAYKGLSQRTFHSPEIASAHSYIMGTLNKSGARLLGKDRFGKLYWHWACTGGIIIENLDIEISSESTSTQKWAYINDKETLDKLLDSLNVNGRREKELYTNILFNKQRLIDSFVAFNKWRENLKFIKNLPEDTEKMLAYFKHAFSKYSSYLDKEVKESKVTQINVKEVSKMVKGLMNFDSRLKAFYVSNIEGLICLKDLKTYDDIMLQEIKDKLLSIKILFYDFSSKLVLTLKSFNEGKDIVASIESMTTYKQGIHLAHRIYKESLVYLEQTKGLHRKLTVNEKSIKASLNILLNWTRSSPNFKLISKAVEDENDTSFQSAEQLALWLTAVEDYLLTVNIEEEEINNDQGVLEVNGYKSTINCKHHFFLTETNTPGCHYHYTKFPNNYKVEVFINKKVIVRTPGDNLDMSNSEDSTLTQLSDDQSSNSEVMPAKFTKIQKSKSNRTSKSNDRRTSLRIAKKVDYTELIPVEQSPRKRTLRETKKINYAELAIINKSSSTSDYVLVESPTKKNTRKLSLRSSRGMFRTIIEATVNDNSTYNSDDQDKKDNDNLTSDSDKQVGKDNETNNIRSISDDNSNSM